MNKKDQHQRSVETLSLSGHGDGYIIPELYDWCLYLDIELSHEEAIQLSKWIVEYQLDALKDLSHDQFR